MSEYTQFFDSLINELNTIKEEEEQCISYNSLIFPPNQEVEVEEIVLTKEQKQQEKLNKLISNFWR